MLSGADRGAKCFEGRAVWPWCGRLSPGRMSLRREEHPSCQTPARRCFSGRSQGENERSGVCPVGEPRARAAIVFLPMEAKRLNNSRGRKLLPVSRGRCLLFFVVINTLAPTANLTWRANGMSKAQVGPCTVTGLVIIFLHNYN